MPFSLTILGSSSAIPTLLRNPSAHLLNVNERLFLIDCAEGTQLQIRRYHKHLQRINKILISHLHGDHYFGLIGLINTFHLLGRKEELHLFGPAMLKEIIDIQLETSMTVLNYPLIFHITSDHGYDLLFEDETLSVHSFPLLHSIPTCGFIFREKRQERKIVKELIDELKIPVPVIKKIKKGEGYTDDNGVFYSNEKLTVEPATPRSYAYCSDTAFTESIIPYIQGCDLLYHEATFLHEKAGVAKEKFHSTALEAAQIASKAGVRKLIIGHFSARYDDPEPLLAEARSVFKETYLAEDGKIFQI